MAEVGHRLLSGAYRFTAVRNSHALPACSGDSPGSSDLRQLLARRKTLWSRRAVSVNLDAFRSYSGKNNDAGPLYRSRTSYYDILRVSPGATQSQIKTAYYKQSFIYHPDKNPGNKAAVQRFSEVSEAYAVLGNVTLRRKYDRGILGPSDLQSPGRPFSKESTVGSPGFKQQHRAQQFSQTRGKVHFDFDAFYQAHYGEQLQREKALRARRKQMQEQQDKARLSWKKDKMMEIAAALLLTTAGLLFVSVSKP
ncbi:DnaJ -like protein subfamily C member 30 [Takifugu flavidus]|uniref:DnaJ-like protein subfamily C member 30 n=1 Tax=Takifugu flavidus TaxID=433684 RepID=A0A5C6PES6_9TELE|nr:DnaJ -like protein subfamily C member 30 [Takifugu flavidus]